MKFITVRELATKNRETRKKISQGDSVLTLNGKPIAYMIPVNEDNFEYVVNESIRSRAKSAWESMRKTAAASGVMEKEVLADLKAFRKERNKRLKEK